MQIIRRELNEIRLQYPLENVCDIDKCLFIDIETTGFTAKSSNLYLIGCVYFKEGTFNTIQFFADKYSDEKELLEEFFSFASDYNFLIHFNGNNFDIPYIENKARELGIDNSLKEYNGIDIYKRVAPYKDFLKLENCKLKSIEKFLKIDRDDKYSGGDLIGIYHSYVDNNNEEALNLLLLHNFDDIQGMLNILPILSYVDMFNTPLTVTKVSASYFTDIFGNERSELLMAFDTPVILPIPVSFSKEGLYFAGGGNQAMIKVPLYEEEMKYFYAGYKDYYYLPVEDVALHKSVAAFVDKEHREPCKASNCYTKKTSKFLPEWDAMINPFFKRNYESKNLYWELTEERRTDRKLFSEYASHVLDHMAK